MNTKNALRSAPLLLAAIFGLVLAVAPGARAANGNVHVSRFWHNHQPIYWPDWNRNGSQTQRGQYAWDSIVLKDSQTFNGLSPVRHPENNLTDIFGLDDRKNAYQGGPNSSLQSFSGGGFAMSYSGSLISNVRQLGGGGHLGYGGGWNQGNIQARNAGRLDLLGFTYHHSLAPLLPKEVFRKELQIFKQAWWKAWGGNSDLSDHSKGFFPTEMAYSRHLIDVLVDEGYEWVIVPSHHISRTSPSYNTKANPEGSYGIFSSPPNKADQLGPVINDGWWYGEPNPGNAAWNVAPFAYQLHKVQYVNPESGAIKEMIAVPSDDVLSYRYGYASEGIGKIQANIAPYATDPNRPVIVMPSTDGDNAWGGGSSSWMEATPQFFNASADAGYVKNMPGSFVNAYKQYAPVTHIEDGAWIFPEMDYGSPNFLKWIEPPVNPKNIASCYPNTMVDMETPGYALKFFSYAPLMAGANWCITAEQILREEGGDVRPWVIADPYDWDGNGFGDRNDVELAWHIYLKGLDSGFNYYGGLGNDDELKPALATKNAIDKLQGFMSSRMAKDKTPPTVLKPQRFPYNPGAYTFGWFNRVPQVNEAFLKKMGSEFYIWTHAYDVSGVQTINVKIRIDNDGVNSMQSTHNETYAGGSEVGSWVTIPMTKRVLPKTRTELNAKADNGQIDFVVFDPAYWADPQIADYYFAKITDQNLNGFRGKLLDYYIEATDTRGNTQKSEIQHVWVEHDGGQSSVAPSATFDPTNPSDCAPITVNFNAATSPLATAAVVNVSYHFSTNSGDWVQTAMTRTSTNTFTYTFNTVPDNAPQLEVAFTDGVNWENNGSANWKTAIRDCDAPVNGVLFDPAAPNGCDPVTIRYYPAGRPLDGAASVYIHVGRNGWQDTISPDPLMTQVGSYWEYIYVVEDDTVAIDVVFNNGAGLWDSNGGSDWHVAVTNCGSMPEPLPAVSINPAAPVGCGPITITYNPSGRVLLGADPVKIHIGRNGWQDVILPNPNMTKSGSTWTYAYTPPPGTTNINMVFNDGGAVWDNNTEMNWNFAVVGCEDIPTGLAITNPAGNITVPFATTHADLQGIAEGLTGHLAWTNSLTGAAGTFPAAATWSLPGLALAVGGNEFVVSGSNTTAAGTTTTAIDDASDAAYSDGWNTGNNGGSGFLGWTLNVTSNAGHFISAETGFGLWAQSESLSEAIRPFSSPLAVGKTFSVRMKNGYVQEGAGGLGVALQNATGDTLWQFWFNGGDTNYNRSGGTTDVAWTMSPIALTVEMTGDTTYNLTVQPEGEAARSYSGTLEDNADQSVTRFRTWLWNNGEGSDYDFYVNNLMITAPSAGNVETHSDFVVITRQSGGTPPPFTMELNPDFTGSGLGFRLATSEAGAQYAVWASPILFPTQNWQMIVGTETQATGGPIDLSITNGLLPINFYRIGYTISP